MVTIRRLVAQDKAAWLPLWQEYLHFYRATLTEQVIDSAFASLCAGEDVLGLVAEDAEGKLLGLMHMVYHASTWSQNGYCYIEDLFVAKQARGQNVANQLFEKAYRLADEQQCDRVYWMTQEFNAPARSLYDTIGKRTSFLIYMRQS